MTIGTLSADMQKQLIQGRLANLSRQHFEAKLDETQHIAMGSSTDTERVQERIASIEKAYTAIEALLSQPPFTTV